MKWYSVSLRWESTAGGCTGSCLQQAVWGGGCLMTLTFYHPAQSIEMLHSNQIPEVVLSGNTSSVTEEGTSDKGLVFCCRVSR